MHVRNQLQIMCDDYGRLAVVDDEYVGFEEDFQLHDLTSIFILRTTVRAGAHRISLDQRYRGRYVAFVYGSDRTHSFGYSLPASGMFF
ncbi:unnamed protein product [Gongylonema pulchrum]|uniref:AraC family transcriptional regulator n=1 Tax=Gongylonema pulchrum TaxID=637853 RepID=A0A183EQB1_9BILA|nr:unnamed protein product [Gongylonema pulchrum]